MKKAVWRRQIPNGLFIPDKERERIRFSLMDRGGNFVYTKDTKGSMRSNFALNFMNLYYSPNTEEMKKNEIN